MAPAKMRDQILDAAEKRARSKGYNGFSFRELADDVGVKSASVHYHFPTKGELAEVLAARYTERAETFLRDPAPNSADEALRRVVDLFRNTFVVQDNMCLCGIFAVERDALPAPLSAQVAEFFEMVLRFLRDAFGPDWSGPAPETVLAQLEGAMIVGRILNSKEVFAKATDNLISGAQPRV